MKPTVGRVVHYYDGRSNGPWMAWVVWIGENDLELYVIPPNGTDAPGYRVVSKEPRLGCFSDEPTREDLAHHVPAGIPFWVWPPRA